MSVGSDHSALPRREGRPLQETSHELEASTYSNFCHPITAILGLSGEGDSSLGAPISHCPPHLTSGKSPTGLVKTSSSREPHTPELHLPLALLSLLIHSQIAYEAYTGALGT